MSHCLPDIKQEIVFLFSIQHNHPQSSPKSPRIRHIEAMRRTTHRENLHPFSFRVAKRNFHQKIFNFPHFQLVANR